MGAANWHSSFRMVDKNRIHKFLAFFVMFKYIYYLLLFGLWGASNLGQA